MSEGYKENKKDTMSDFTSECAEALEQYLEEDFEIEIKIKDLESKKDKGKKKDENDIHIQE